jgi:hypothetical protein
MAVNNLNQSQLWKDLHDLFDTDDGSLPEIELTNLNGSQIGNIFSYLLSLGKNKKLDLGSFWDNKLNQERLISSVKNAAILVTEYTAAPFHILVSSIEFNGVTIPDLGVFIFQEMISLDYRMGVQWGPSQLMAFFQLLNQIKKLAPDVRVILPEGESENIREKFQQVWEQYLQENAGSNCLT